MIVELKSVKKSNLDIFFKFPEEISFITPTTPWWGKQNCGHFGG
jgi:hypothetical protein